jgi:phosphoribosylformylglycinamidine (FGAM) synthase-like amidotransferase family enzyme
MSACTKHECVEERRRNRILREAVEHHEGQAVWAQRQVKELEEALDAVLRLSPLVQELRERIATLEKGSPDAD